ncbi:MAG: NRDE family protein [Syntrophomonadaceae bacterium]|jgi:uncharacterized protein with NRDE domain|nr:NRDE family protein [Syntrophomonadaceae bacterium]
MCLILFALDSHPRYKLVVVSNRDEFYKRPTAAAGFWPEKPGILAGKDIRDGGTWLGITRQGRFAALTNYRDPKNTKPSAPSRGHLVLDYLENQVPAAAYLNNLPAGGKAYNGFNLLVGNIDEFYYYSNREEKIRTINTGVHALSNSLLDTPWPKAARGTRELANILAREEIITEDLFVLMKNQDVPADHDLPDTGVGLEMERWLAPAFIISAEYGTRTTSLLLVDRDNKVQFWERSYEPQKMAIADEVYYEYVISSLSPA